MGRIVKSQRVRYECVGGPRDGEIVEIPERARWVTLDEQRYYVGSMIKHNADGEALWEVKCLVWDAYLSR
jgi:hypothetical protein